jgi:hypothetical protein
MKRMNVGGGRSHPHEGAHLKAEVDDEGGRLTWRRGERHNREKGGDKTRRHRLPQG